MGELVVGPLVDANTLPTIRWTLRRKGDVPFFKKRRID
jgi:hypothetical protein